MARAKNRQTFNKITRERELRERRERKQEKKDEKKRLAAEGIDPNAEDESAEPELAVEVES
jgi:hypothetical protein